MVRRSGGSVSSLPRTVRRVFGTLNAILNYANECELIVRNPCRGVKLPSARRVERPLPSAEQLADLAAELGDEFGIMVYLGAVLGLRWGECAGLRVGRIDFIRSTLTVAEQITRGSHGEPTNGPPKSSAGNRTLSMPASLVATLAAHLARRGLTGANSDAFVLTMPGGGPLVYQNSRIRFWLRDEQRGIRSLFGPEELAAGSAVEAEYHHEPPWPPLGTADNG
jgi:integrase